MMVDLPDDVGEWLASQVADDTASFFSTLDQDTTDERS